jgi:hypothetical protein
VSSRVSLIGAENCCTRNSKTLLISPHEGLGFSRIHACSNPRNLPDKFEAKLQLCPPSINSKLLKPSQIQKHNFTLYQQGLGVFGSVEECGGLVCVLLAVKYSGMD